MILSKVKDKAAPLKALSGPEGSRKLRYSDFVTTVQDGGKVVSITHRWVRVIKSRRMRWVGNVARMGEEKVCIESWWGNWREGDH